MAHLELGDLIRAEFSTIIGNGSLISSFHGAGFGRKSPLSIGLIGADGLLALSKIDHGAIFELDFELPAIDLNVFIDGIREDNHEVRGVTDHVETDFLHDYAVNAT